MTDDETIDLRGRDHHRHDRRLGGARLKIKRLDPSPPWLVL
jgi:hypothetical protein